MENDGSLSLKHDKSCPQELGTGTSACTLVKKMGQTEQGIFVGSFIYCSVQSTGCNYHQSFLAIELAPDITVLLLEQNILANREFTFSHGVCTAFLFLRNAAGRETDPTVTNFSWVETCLLQTAPWVWRCVQGHRWRSFVGLVASCSDPTATSTLMTK